MGFRYASQPALAATIGFVASTQQLGWMFLIRCRIKLGEQTFYYQYSHPDSPLELAGDVLACILWGSPAPFLSPQLCVTVSRSVCQHASRMF